MWNHIRKLLQFFIGLREFYILLLYLLTLLQKLSLIFIFTLQLVDLYLLFTNIVTNFNIQRLQISLLIFYTFLQLRVSKLIRIRLFKILQISINRSQKLISLHRIQLILRCYGNIKPLICEWNSTFKIAQIVVQLPQIDEVDLFSVYIAQIKHQMTRFFGKDQCVSRIIFQTIRTTYLRQSQRNHLLILAFLGKF